MLHLDRNKIELKRVFSVLLANVGIILEGKFIQPLQGSFPRNNIAVIMSGSPASGKSTVINEQLLVDGKILDIDNIVKIYKKVLNTRYYSLKTEEERAVFSLKYNNLLPIPDEYEPTKDEITYWNHLVTNKLGQLKLDEDGEYIIDKTEGTYIPKGGYVRTGLLRESEKVFKKASKIKFRLPNIIYDITGNKTTGLIQTANLLKDMGYYVMYVCVVTTQDRALSNNRLRKHRHINEEYVNEVYRNVYREVPKALLRGEFLSVDEAWVVFANDSKINFVKKPGYNKKILQDVNTNRFWANNTAYRLKKENGKFILPKNLIERYLNITGYKFGLDE